MAFPWYVLAILFLLPFVDPRRPFRLLHLDLLALIAVGRWPLVAIDGQPPSVRPTVLALTYLFGRLLWSGFRPRERRGPLIPLVPVSWLAIAVVLLAGFRLSYVIEDRAPLVDVGAASVIGADRLASGGDLYDGGLAKYFPHGDTYGPVTYLGYVPFEQVLPLGSNYTEPDAARAAAVAFDLLTLLGLLLLGRRLRPGPEGQRLGVALAFAWVSYPSSLLVMRYGFNDALVALLLVGAMLALHSPAGRGILSALAAATKFAPALLAPLLATGTGERRLRSLLVFAAAFGAVTLAVFLPFIPDGGPKELYERTLGFQAGRTAGLVPRLGWLQTPLQFAMVGLAVLLAFVPKHRTPLQVAALGAALLVSLQLTGTHWLLSYTVWFAPMAFTAFLGVYRSDDRHSRSAGTAGRRPKSA